MTEFVSECAGHLSEILRKLTCAYGYHVRVDSGANLSAPANRASYANDKVGIGWAARLKKVPGLLLPVCRIVPQGCRLVCALVLCVGVILVSSM